MGSRLRLNLVLAAIVIALVFVVLFEPGKESAPETPPLTAFKPETIRRAQIERSGRDTIVLEKQGEKWRITQPLNLPANEFRVTSVLRIAQASSFARFPAGGRDLKQYELDAPAVKLTLNDQVLEFGGVNPLDRRRYVRIGDTIHLTGDDVYFRLTGDATGFVSTALWPDVTAPIEEITAPGLSIRNDGGKWIVTPPIEGLSADDTNKFIDEWKHAQALQVSAYKGLPGAQTVTVRFGGGTPAITFDIVSGETGDLILGRKDLGVQYELAPETRKRLLTLKPAPPPAAESAPQPPSP